MKEMVDTFDSFHWLSSVRCLEVGRVIQQKQFNIEGKRHSVFIVFFVTDLAFYTIIAGWHVWK